MRFESAPVIENKEEIKEEDAVVGNFIKVIESYEKQEPEKGFREVKNEVLELLKQYNTIDQEKNYSDAEKLKEKEKILDKGILLKQIIQDTYSEAYEANETYDELVASLSYLEGVKKEERKKDLESFKKGEMTLEDLFKKMAK